MMGVCQPLKMRNLLLVRWRRLSERLELLHHPRIGHLLRRGRGLRSTLRLSWSTLGLLLCLLKLSELLTSLIGRLLYPLDFAQLLLSAVNLTLQRQ